MQTGISQSNKQALRNPWVIGWIAMVVIVFGVNIFMVSQAFIGAPGLVSKNYYERGRNLEKSIQSRKRLQATLGWNLNLETAEIHSGKPAGFRFQAADKTGQPLKAADVVLYAYRPSDATSDFSIPLAEKSPGLYVGDITFPLKGLWDVVIEVKQGDGVSQLARRVAALGY